MHDSRPAARSNLAACVNLKLNEARKNASIDRNCMYCLLWANRKVEVV